MQAASARSWMTTVLSAFPLLRNEVKINASLSLLYRSRRDLTAEVNWTTARSADGQQTLDVNTAALVVLTFRHARIVLKPVFVADTVVMFFPVGTLVDKTVSTSEEAAFKRAYPNCSWSRARKALFVENLKESCLAKLGFSTQATLAEEPRRNKRQKTVKGVVVESKLPENEGVLVPKNAALADALVIPTMTDDDGVLVPKNDATVPAVDIPTVTDGHQLNSFPKNAALADALDIPTDDDQLLSFELEGDQARDRLATGETLAARYAAGRRDPDEAYRARVCALETWRKSPLD